MKRIWFVFLIYGTLTIALTYPFFLHFRSVMPSHLADTGLNTWILWWNAKTLPLTSAWWNPPVFYPAFGALSFSENLLGLSLISTPLQWLNVGPQTAYNVVFLLTFPLSALGAYLLAEEVTQRQDAAFLAGLLFGFAPYRIAQLDHIQVLASYPMPFALLGLHRSLRDPRLRWLTLFAGSWLLQGLCNGYYLLFFSVLVGFWLLWFASPRSRPKTFTAIGAAWLIAALLLLPLLLHYRYIHQIYGFARDFDVVRQYSADVLALFKADRWLRLWGWLNSFSRIEGTLFPGVTVVLLMFAGALFIRRNQPLLVRRWQFARRALLVLMAISALVALSVVFIGSHRSTIFGLSVSDLLTISVALGLGWALTSDNLRCAYATRSVLSFYALAAFITWSLCLGPVPTLMGYPVLFRGPYALLMFFPGFNTLRVPARFWMVTTLCLAVAAAIIFDRLTAGSLRKRQVLAGLVAFGILADTWMVAMPMATPPHPFPVINCELPGPSGPVLELPLKNVYSDITAMYRQMTDRLPLVNGYSGYYPPHYSPLRLGLALRDPDMLSELAGVGVTDIIVDRELDPGGRWDEYVSAYPGAKLICSVGKQTLYRLGRGKATRTAPQGPLLPIAQIRATVNAEAVAAMTDGDPTTLWRSGPQREGTTVEVDLGAVRTVAEIELWLGAFPEAFPRRSVIEASEDGESWREVWSGASASLAFVGAIEKPAEVPLHYRFSATPARKLRMRLTANDDAYQWAICELRVRGP